MEETTRTRFETLNDRQNQLREMERQKEDGCASVALERRLEIQKQMVRIATDRVHELEGYDMELGYIFASSEFRVGESGCAMDWGLVEVDEKRIAGNLVSTLRFRDLKIHGMSINLSTIAATMRNIPHLIDHVTNISYFYEDGRKAHKFGRSTDLTHGRFSFI